MNRRAFTLVESIVTLALMVILAIVIAPSLLNGSHTNDLDNATEQITASTRDVQTKASSQAGGTAWGIHFANPTNSAPYYAVFQGASYASGTVTSYERLPSTLGYVSSTLPLGGSVDITFSPISGAASASTTIGLYVLSQPSISSTITIASSGYIAMMTPMTAGQSGSGSGGSGGSGGGPAPAKNIYVSDEANYISVFNASGTYLWRFGSYGTGNGQFNVPGAIAFDANGNIWITDDLNYRVEEFNASGTYLSQFGSYGTGNAQFKSPQGIAIDHNGDIWVTDANNNRVEEFNASGTYILQLGSCTSGACSQGSGNGQLGYPEWVAVDPNGNIWVADYTNHRVQEFSPSGAYISKVGSSGTGNGQFSFPGAIAFDASGDMWVGDYANYRVEEFSPSGSYLSQFGSYGTGNGQFDGIPTGIAVDSNGNIWVGDTVDYRVEEFNASGTYISQVGCPSGPCSYGTNPGETDAPEGVTAH
ncbi:MAG TPA: hypothetical protein VMT81_01340 [Candidatus Paceibacterota bacterium]|nr:hypothetical protein [Candidatus Paceibacterota bacterium]